jgi:hypothetical protein
MTARPALWQAVRDDVIVTDVPRVTAVYYSINDFDAMYVDSCQSVTFLDVVRFMCAFCNTSRHGVAVLPPASLSVSVNVTMFLMSILTTGLVCFKC